MTGADLFMLFSMLFLVGICAVKIGNVMKFGDLYERMYVFILFFVSGIFYLLLLLTAMAEHTMLYAMYLNVATFIFLFTVVLTIVEVVIGITPKKRRARH